MEHGPLQETEATRYSAEDRRTILVLAKDSVHHGLAFRRPLPMRPDVLSPALRELRACFVTLTLGGALRGCIGRLEATRTLGEDVVENAFAAAYFDRRFNPVGYHELDALEYHISILSPPEPMCFGSQEELIEQLRPDIDGIILEEGSYSGTFLPAVWRTTPEPRSFLEHLKRKAGLPGDYWSATLRVWRYTTEVVE